MNLKDNNIEKQLDELQFASCPTETKDPFFWRWTKEGKETLNLFILALLEAEEKEIEEKLSKIEKIRCEEAIKKERERILNELTSPLWAENKETMELAKLVEKVLRNP